MLRNSNDIQPIAPTIRLISSTPSASGTSSASNIGVPPLPPLPASSYSTFPAPSALAPKPDSPAPRKRLVPKKSRLNILSGGRADKERERDRERERERGKDLSDVVRRVGASSSIGRGGAGFEIYVDPHPIAPGNINIDDEDIAEIVVLRKKRRAGLDGVRWGSRDEGTTLGEVTNVPRATGKEKEEREGKKEEREGKKEERENKWWSIARGRKDSKEKEKRAKSPGTRDPYPRSKTPEPFKTTQPEPSRTRFNSLGANFLFSSTANASAEASAGTGTATASATEPKSEVGPGPVPEVTHTRSRTPTLSLSLGGLLGSQTNATAAAAATTTTANGHQNSSQNQNQNQNQNQGSIAIRAMRSMRSLARIGSWAQLRGGGGGDENVPPVKERKERKGKERKEKGTVKAREGKEDGKGSKKGKKGKSKKEKEEKGKDKEGEEGRKKRKLKKERDKEREMSDPTTPTATLRPVRGSTSSFEVGSASPVSKEREREREREKDQEKEKDKGLGKKKRSILGLGLPSTIGKSMSMGMTMRLRSGSSASVSVRDGVSAPAPSATVNANMNANKLSVDSAHAPILIIGRDRAASVMSTSTTNTATTNESLRPVSVVSGKGNRLSSGSGSSVRWDEGCLESGREERRRERKERERERERERGREKDEKGRERKEKEKGKGKTKEREEGRRRTPISEVFPDWGRGAEVCGEEGVHREEEEEEEERKMQMPVVMVETATADGHSDSGFGDEVLSEEQRVDGVEEEEEEKRLETPVRRARHRWLSEQLVGTSRPRPLYEGEDGVLSILDAATNDLAQLINHLDLEATPATPDMTPLRPSTLSKNGGGTDEGDHGNGTLEINNSPTRNKSTRLGSAKPRDVPSVSSLRPYAQSRRNTLSTKPLVEQVQTIGRQIAPWPVLFSPVKSPKASSTPPDKDKHKGRHAEKHEEEEQTPVQRGHLHPHRRTMTPGPEPEPEPVFQPLRPAKSRGAIAALRAQFEAAAASVSASEPKQADRDSTFGGGTGTWTVRAPSLRTFGSHSSSRASKAVSESDASFMSEVSLSSWPTPNRSPVFRRAPSPAPAPASVVPMEVDEENDDDNDTVSILRSKRRMLGMSGTMGGLDSDIPDELQEILNGGDTMSSYREGEVHEALAPMDDILESGPVPPALDLPTFRTELIDEENHPMHAADVDAMSSDEDYDNTKKSFDFTAEIRKLNESGASDRHSFVEQLENAFRTPAKVDLRYAFPTSMLGRVGVEVPPVPKLPVHLVKADVGQSSQEGSSEAFVSGIVDMKEPTLHDMTEESSDGKSGFDLFSGSQIMDVKEPTLLQGSDSLIDNDETHDIVMSDSDADASPSMSRSLKPVSSSGSRPSDGLLNKAFKFGGLPQEAPPVPAVPEHQQQQDLPKTLADIIPPPSHVRSLSNSSSLMLEDDSVLKSIFAKVSDIPQSRPRLNSDSSVQRRVWENAQTQYRHSRHSSGMSFAGLESFDEVRRGFEFSGDQSFYPPPSRPVANPRQRDSLLSIASVSSYGKAHDYGLADPFDYGLPCLRESPSSAISMSMSVDDTFSFIHRQPRKRVASDASSFYFKTSVSRRQSRRESGMSVASLAPPVSLFNRNFGSHRRNDSSSSAQSVALTYATHGASGGRAIWARHRRESSIDSVNSDFSAMRLGRPGIGDKMFDGMLENSVGDHCVALRAISASPAESVAQPHLTVNRSSFEFDSIIDHEPKSLTVEDSLFEKTGGEKSSSLSDSVFGCNDDSQASKATLLEVPRYRPLSVISMNAPNSPVREDDTMISMLGGGHVRRRSIDASPCPRIEKRKHSEIQSQGLNASSEYRESPNKARIVEKPSIASTSSSSFGGEPMIKAKHGLLERQSLEETVLIADGEDVQSSLPNVPMFSRPGPATRSRSSTCTSSSGGDTPPLSSCDGSSSMDEGSQSSIDLDQIDAALADATHPLPTLARHKVRARARGHGHCRRAQASRSSVYETIEEEKMGSPSPNKASPPSQDTPTICQPVFIMEPETNEIDPGQIWNDESGLRRYYALRDEAQTTVVESKRIWRDTPFSIFAVQSFEPPRHPAGMQALLDYSVKNYGPLPSELRPRRVRSRTSSRLSPYPQARVGKVVPPLSEKVQPAKNTPSPSVNVPVLQQVPINTNIASTASLHALKPFLPVVKDIQPKQEGAFAALPHSRLPRASSAVRRNALGSTKRSSGSTKTSTDLKENVGQGTLTTSGASLRINRPRPRGRPNPASTARPIRV